MPVGLDLLGGESVLASGSTDVSIAREKARRARLVRICVPLAIVAGYLWIRIVRGHPVTPSWPHLPSAWVPFLPGAILMIVLGAVIVIPLMISGRSPHVVYRPEAKGPRLADLKGMPAVVEEVVRTLNLFLANETFADRMGGTQRRGILFEGPPGTGKTFIARAMANEAGVPFLFVSSSAFQSMYYGQTNRKVRAYFKALRRAARAEGGAIGFIEEIDAIGGTRAGMGGRGEGVAGVVNELLIQLQSFNAPGPLAAASASVVDQINRLLPPTVQLPRPVGKPANVLVVGATNRAADLDPALLRPGRFDRSVHFDLPGKAGRREIIDYYLGRKAHDEELDIDGRRDELASITLGYTPVMLEHLLDEGLVWALRGGRERMGWEDVARARLTEELGIANRVTYTDAERLRIASHEAGHATVAWLVGHGRRLEVLSIVKRGAALGLLAHGEMEERFTKTREELFALVQIAMGGLAAEELLFGEHSTGVAGDLTAATGIAAQMVGSLGMAGSLISYDPAAPRGGLVAKVLSSDQAAEAVETLLAEARANASALLLANRDRLERLAGVLVDREELLGDEIIEVLEDRAELVIDLRGEEVAAD